MDRFGDFQVLSEMQVYAAKMQTGSLKSFIRHEVVERHTF
jgi:hypothetical protein